MIKAIRDALFTVVEAIDISSVWPAWESATTYPPKQLICPAFWVEPVGNTSEVLDSATNLGTYTYAVVLTGSYENAPVDEDTVVELADLVYRRLLEATHNTEVLGEGLEVAFDGTPSGSWSFDERYGERVYRIEVAVRAAEEFELTP